jgi:hypothetical protein
MAIDEARRIRSLAAAWTALNDPTWGAEDRVPLARLLLELQGRAADMERHGLSRL